MTNQVLNKKEIKKEAQQLLKQGLSRQETFEIIKEKYKYTKEVADIIRYLPSQQAIKKYAKWNYVLLGLLVLILLIFIFNSPTFAVFLCYGLLIYVVARMLLKYYIWITIFSAIIIIVAVTMPFVSNVSIIADGWQIAVFFFLFILTLILPFWIEKKLCPKPIEEKESYTNSQGQQRLRIRYEFPD